MDEQTAVRLEFTINQLKELRTKLNKIVTPKQIREKFYIDLLIKYKHAKCKQDLYNAITYYEYIMCDSKLFKKDEKLKNKLEKEYGGLLSKRYYEPKYLDKLIEVLENGTAENIKQAIELVLKQSELIAKNDYIEKVAAENNLR